MGIHYPFLISNRIVYLCRNSKQKFKKYDSQAKIFKSSLPGIHVVYG